MTRTMKLLFAAGVSLALLAGCGEDTAVQEEQEDPAIAEEPTPDTTEDETGEAVDRIREGAESITEGAGELFEEGREAAERALEDAGPALDQAGEAAREVGEAVDAIVKRAVSDFNAAVEELNRRIDNFEGDLEPVDDDPATALPPIEQLNEDTKAAARAVPADIGPAYVGVWAGEAADCKRIDQEAVELFAVITPTTMRRHDNVCNFAESMPVTDGTATVAASCIAEGTTEERQVTFSMPTEDVLRIGTPSSEAEAELVRCHLPQ